jgi:cytochrome c oxidase subunit 3
MSSTPTRDRAPAATGLDVSALPSFGFGRRSLTWWGTLGMMAIEGTLFALAVASYFFLRSHVAVWPMSEPPPQLAWGTLNTALLVASLLPNHLSQRASERLDHAACRRWASVTLLAGLLALVLRALEFGSLNCRWDSDAYGSIVWTLLGLHTLHLLTDTWDSAVLVVLLFTGPWEGKRFVDVQENAIYWLFVVLSWLPLYAVLYWAPRGAAPA